MTAGELPKEMCGNVLRTADVRASIRPAITFYGVQHTVPKSPNSQHNTGLVAGSFARGSSPQSLDRVRALWTQATQEQRTREVIISKTGKIDRDAGDATGSSPSCSFYLNVWKSCSYPQAVGVLGEKRLVSEKDPSVRHRPYWGQRHHPLPGLVTASYTVPQ